MKNLIKDIRLSKGLTRPELAEKIGMDTQALYRLEIKEDGVNLTSLLKIAAALEVNASDLISYDDELSFDIGSIDDLSKIYRAYNEYKLKLIPVIDWADAMNYEQVLKRKFQNFVVAYKLVSDNSFALEIEDLRMQPRFLIGDKIIIDGDAVPKPGDFCIGTMDNLKASLLYFKSEDEENAVFTPTLRKDEGNFVLPLSKTSSKIFGKVIDVVTSLEEVYAE